MPYHPYRWLVLAGCWLNYFVFGLGITSLAPLVQPIMADLDLSRWLRGAYAIPDAAESEDGDEASPAEQPTGDDTRGRGEH